jgi:hypothetical protein
MILKLNKLLPAIVVKFVKLRFSRFLPVARK